MRGPVLALGLCSCISAWVQPPLLNQPTFTSKRVARSAGNTVMFFGAFGGGRSSGTASSKLTPIPSGATVYDDMRKQAVDSVAAALKSGATKLEVEVPIGKGKIDVSLGEYLDESRQWTLQFLIALTPKYPTARGSGLWVVFPDAGEANIAAKDWGTTRYRICGIRKALEAPMEDQCQLMVVVTPGFNIDEYLDIEKLGKRREGVPMLIINGNLDRVKSGYYPQVFYPQLASANNRFIKYFDPVYYLKPLPGGFLFRKYPEQWQQIFQAYGPEDPKTKKRPILTKVLETSDERPAYNTVAQRIKAQGMMANPF